jgi:hypothetical protein
MTSSTPISIKILLAVFCLFFLGNAYSQEKKKPNKFLFGKAVKTESINPSNGRIRCATTEYEEYLQKKNPNRMSSTQFETWLAPLVNKYKANKSKSKTAGTVITIPVVVHVIYNGQAIGVAPNIVDAQVQSQITVLNQDFRKMLATPGYNSNPVGADLEIQFELAKQDPNGNPTNGIDRVSLCQPTWSDIDIEATLKPATIWDSTKYLNMWSLKFTDNSLLGYAQFPDNNLDPSDPNYLGGLDPIGGAANTDGVVSSYDVFGSKTFDTNNSFLLDATYNKGRTMSHEVGHWLGLLHIWGDATCGEDYCADTPIHHDANYGCPSPIPMSCDTTPVPEMIQNYMDYTDDACMNIFTQNQKDRVSTIMNNAARRVSLKTSTKNVAIPLFANDGEVKLEGSCPATLCGAVPNQTTQKITIYNRGTNNLTSATLNYKINGGSNQVYNWSGNLAINNQASFDITINAPSNGTITVNIATVNGGTDQRSSNNSASGTFIIPTTNNYAYTDYVFRLQKDLKASQTSWSLKNSAGTTLYSGSGYTDKNTLPLPTLFTDNWTLAANQCYTFTINDSAGDGICCADGNGYYDIKTNGGAVIVKSGSNFTSSESITFTTNTLGTTVFENSNDLYLYPNPAKGTINIRFPEGFGLPNAYTISNSLGQIVSKKEVTTANDLTINTYPLSNGVYFITVAKENQTKTLQFIKE